MSTGAGPASQSGKKRKEFWEFSNRRSRRTEKRKYLLGLLRARRSMRRRYSRSSTHQMMTWRRRRVQKGKGTPPARMMPVDQTLMVASRGSGIGTNQGRHHQARVYSHDHRRVPSEPERFAEGYGRQVAVNLRNTVPITTINLRSRDNNHCR